MTMVDLFVSRLRSLTFKIETSEHDILKNRSGWKIEPLSNFIFGSAPRIGPILVSSHFYIPIIPKNYWTLFKLNSWLIQLRIYKTCNIYIHLGNDMKRPIYFHKQWFSSISPLLCCHHWSLFRLFQRQIAGSLWGLVGVISPPNQVA